MIDWRQRAACNVDSGDDWFPAPGKGPSGRLIRQAAVEHAIGICRERCPVQAQCLRSAVSAERNAGIWGGIDFGNEPSAVTKAVRRELLRIADEGGLSGIAPG